MNIISYIFSAPRDEKVRLLLLAVAFFFAIASYTIFRELRDSLFIAFVGRRYIQYAQLSAIAMLFPALFIYSSLVDRYTKYNLLMFCAGFFSLGGLIITWLLGNVGQAGYALLGWGIYLFVEAFAPFMISVLYAFTNSVTPPKEAPESYAAIISGSKLGGILSAGFAWWFLITPYYDELMKHRVLLGVSSLFLTMVPVSIMLLRYFVPEQALHGYEATYKKERDTTTKKEGSWLERLLSGPVLMVRFPYVFGIFLLVFCWEVVSAIVNYHRLCSGAAVCTTTTSLSSFLFQQILFIHAFGLIIALFGIKNIMSWLGERKTLVAVPLITGLLVSGYFMSSLPWIVSICYVVIRALNYSLAISVRETLFIPTSKAIRFKSKSWIDAFGSKFARGMGAVYNLGTSLFNQNLLGSYSLGFCLAVITIWAITARILGKTCESTVKQNKIIGED